jgi:hypothetical protein
MMYKVLASNAKGDKVVEFFNDAEKADVRHNQLYNEVDDRGLWKWGTIRTINLEYNRDDSITGMFGNREGMVPNCIAEVA